MPFKKGETPQGAKPFKKGVSGNPKGKPKMPDIKDALIKILSDEKEGRTALDAILAALRAKAVKGDVKAAQELLDRAFGKSKQIIEQDIEVKGNAVVIDWSNATQDKTDNQAT
jgi:hypothetical protein